MIVHSRAPLLTAALALALAAGGVAAGQPTVTVRQEPGKPPQVVLPVTPPPPQGEPPSATVTPGPDPWYTVFGTGEVVGYIEPCG